MVVSGIGHVIVTDQMRAVLEGVSGISEFRSVIKEKVVRLDWSKWNVGEARREFRHLSEPEDMLVQGEHDQQLASDLGDLYEVVLKRDGAIQEDFDVDGNYVVTFGGQPMKGYGFFGAKTASGDAVPVATSDFVASIGSDVKRWLYFTPIE
jgi:hypothetical protein